MELVEKIRKYSSIIIFAIILTPSPIGINKRPAVGVKEYIKLCEASMKCSLLTEVAYYEARGEPDLGRIAVMFVALNRMNNSKWPNTLKEVINQKSQFSYKSDGSLKKGFTEVDQHRRIALLARGVLNGDIEDPTGGALFYHNNTVSPRWIKKKVKVVEIEKHTFYK